MISDIDYEALAAALTPENRFLAWAHDGYNVFLTGAAGTGKSTLVRRFLVENQTCTRHGELALGQEQRWIDITAPTGIAALNIGGLTIHRFAGILLGPKPGQTNEEYADELELSPYHSVRAGMNRVRQAQCVLIDEISMLPGRQLDFLNFWCKRLRGDDRPFGGVQLIVVGDFLQLPPVRTSETQPYDWAFTSEAWREAGFQTVELETVRRQDDPAFVQALMSFRIGRIRGQTAALLQERVKMFPPASTPRLFTHNAQVDRWNNFMLDDLEGEEVVSEAVCRGDESQVEFMARNLPTPLKLRLKRGAMVIFTVNHPQSLWVNGLLGRVEQIQDDAVVVQVRHPKGASEYVTVPRFTWRYDSRDRESANISQFPLRLAYALTIHKSQGLTLDAAHIDIRAAREPGQAYVAVSRVRSLAGLSFKEWFKGVYVSPEAIRLYEAMHD